MFTQATSLRSLTGTGFTSMRLRIYFGGASPNCGAGVRPYLIRRPALAHKNPTCFSRGSMSKVDNDEIERKWNDDISEYVTGDQDKGGLGYGRDQVEWLYSCEVRMRADFITNYG